MTPLPVNTSLADLERGTPFVERHLGPDKSELARMAAAIGVGSLDELADRALPPGDRKSVV